MPTPFFDSPSVRLYEYGGLLRVVTANNAIVAAASPWLLIDATADHGELRLEGAFERDHPRFRVVANLADADAAAAAQVIVARYLLPKRLELVAAAEVESDPRRFHARHLDITAVWTTAFEESSFAGAWLIGCRRAGYDHPSGLKSWARVRAQGIWLCEENRGYGHLGASKACFVTYRADVLGPP